MKNILRNKIKLLKEINNTFKIIEIWLKTLMLKILKLSLFMQKGSNIKERNHIIGLKYNNLGALFRTEVSHFGWNNYNKSNNYKRIMIIKMEY